ncbi:MULTISPECIES: hypothetical protein [unclassified Bradyrhizobium]|uniref:hypothetical protein n=1 Tax=unclassified Bradyrhizobium TaxID=2631580 RepID=UPI002FEED742
MEQSLEVRTQRLLQISIDLHNRMAEIQKLREMVRSAEAAQRSQEPVHPAIIGQPVGNELHV